MGNVPETKPTSSKPEPPFVLAIDVGTSSARVTAFDARGRRLPRATASAAHTPRTTPEGAAELDPDRLVERVVALLEETLPHVPWPEAIAGVAVTTFWHSVLGVDAAGRAITPIYTWADTRSTAAEAELRERLDEAAVHARTGCRFHTSYLPARLLWLARAEPDRFRRAAWWVSPGEYLFLRLFGEPFCSVSMASGTGLLDQRRLVWDEELLSALPIEPEQLATIVSLTETARGLRPEFAGRLPALRDVPWVAAVGDGAASNLGSGCTSPERVALMVGTSGAMRALLGRGYTPPPEGLWAYRVDAARPLVGGALSNGGNLLAWLRDMLRLPAPEAVEAEVAAMAPDAHGLTVLPFVAGERSVGWRADARAAIVGLSWSTRPAEVFRAGMEAIALRFARILERLRPLLPPERTFIASGGALLSSPAWLQMMADALGEPVVASEEAEASSRGVALLALETLGVRALSEIDFPLARRYEPGPERHAVYQEAADRQERLYDLLLVKSRVGARRV